MHGDPLASLDVIDGLGKRLRALRLAGGLTGEQVADALGWSQAKVSRFESGRIGITVPDLVALLDHLGAPGSVRAELLARAAAGDGQVWAVRHGSAPERQAVVADVEQGLKRVREHHPLVVPGLLQTPAYTLAMARAAGYPKAESLAAGRSQRGEAAKLGGMQYEALMDARSLTRHAGGVEVAAEQAERLLKVMKEPNVRLSVLPETHDARALALSPFALYDFHDPEVPPLVLVETTFVDVFHTSGDDVAAFERLWHDLSATALSAKETRAWLQAVRDGEG